MLGYLLSTTATVGSMLTKKKTTWHLSVIISPHASA